MEDFNFDGLEILKSGKLVLCKNGYIFKSVIDNSIFSDILNNTWLDSPPAHETPFFSGLYTYPQNVGDIYFAGDTSANDGVFRRNSFSDYLDNLNEGF